MFKAKQQTEEQESDSDWDSIPGDVVSETSSPEPIPQFQPTPPTSGPNKTAYIKGKQQSKPSSLTNPASAKKSLLEFDRNSPVSSQATQRPSQLYGKAGVTSFTDRNLEQRPQKELSQLLDLNTNGSQMTGEGMATDRGEEVMIEMNKMSHEVNNPPYTDFQANVSHSNSKKDKSSKQKKAKMKASYFASQSNHLEEEAGSWNDESDRENQEHVFGSQHKLTHSKQGMIDQAHHSKICPPSKDQTALALKNDNNIKDPVVGYVSESDFGSNKLDNNCCPISKRTDIEEYKYYFNHGHNQHLDIQPDWRVVQMKRVADRSEKWSKYFWQEFFNFLRLFVDFALILAMEAITFVVRHIVMRIILSLLIIISDHCLKPYLTVLFNNFIQPQFAFLWNVLTACKKAVFPLLDITREIVRQLASLLKAVRLFELTWKPNLNQRSPSRELQVL